MIRFITEQPSQPTSPTFRDVEDNQPFIDHNGSLCQKVTAASFNIIAAPGGEPIADQINGVLRERPIRRVLPLVTKIEF